MNTYFPRLILIAAICFVATALLCGSTAVTQSRTGLSPEEERGKQIYLKGASTEGGEIVAMLAISFKPKPVAKRRD